MKTLAAEIIIVGAGPAGVSAALECSAAGRSVLVLDDNQVAGGQIWRGGEDNDWLRRFHALEIPFVSRAQVIAANYRSSTLVAETPEAALQVKFEKLIIATGAREMFLPFPGWTLPGIMGIGGIQAFVKTGLPVKGKRIVLAGTGPLLMVVGANLRKAGARVTLIAEQAPAATLRPFATEILRRPAKLLAGVRHRLLLLGVPYRFGCWVSAAEGGDRLRSLTIQQENRSWVEHCDYAGIAFGLVPNTELAALLGCRFQGNAVETDLWGETSLPNVYCAGETTGVAGVEAALLEGKIAALAACGKRELGDLKGELTASRKFANSLKKCFALRPELHALPKADTVVCRCEDVSFGQLKEFPSFRAAKLHARCGMGPCQARVCGPPLEFLFGWKPDSVRPPLFPARLGSFTENEEITDKWMGAACSGKE